LPPLRLGSVLDLADRCKCPCQKSDRHPHPASSKKDPEARFETPKKTNGRPGVYAGFHGVCLRSVLSRAASPVRVLWLPLFEGLLAVDPEPDRGIALLLLHYYLRMLGLKFLALSSLLALAVASPVDLEGRSACCGCAISNSRLSDSSRRHASKLRTNQSLLQDQAPGVVSLPFKPGSCMLTHVQQP
jgi:hypothetical protein